jgi:hypothetical protein
MLLPNMNNRARGKNITESYLHTLKLDAATGRTCWLLGTEHIIHSKTTINEFIHVIERKTNSCCCTCSAMVHIIKTERSSQDDCFPYQNAYYPNILARSVPASALSIPSEERCQFKAVSIDLV